MMEEFSDPNLLVFSHRIEWKHFINPSLVHLKKNDDGG